MLTAFLVYFSCEEVKTVSEEVASLEVASVSVETLGSGSERVSSNSGDQKIRYRFVSRLKKY